MNKRLITKNVLKNKKIIYEVKKPTHQDKSKWNDHGRQYAGKGIATFYQQQRNNFDLTFEPPSLEKEVQCLVNELTKKLDQRTA